MVDQFLFPVWARSRMFRISFVDVKQSVCSHVQVSAVRSAMHLEV